MTACYFSEPDVEGDIGRIKRAADAAPSLSLFLGDAGLPVIGKLFKGFITCYRIQAVQ